MAKSHPSLTKLGESLCLAIRGLHTPLPPHLSLCPGYAACERRWLGTAQRWRHGGEMRRSQLRPPPSSASSHAATVAVVHAVPSRDRHRRPRRPQPRPPPPRGFDQAAWIRGLLPWSSSSRAAAAATLCSIAVASGSAKRRGRGRKRGIRGER